MAFEDIECVSAPKPSRTPPSGVAVAVRRLGRSNRTGGGTVSYIKLTIGADLARRISLTQPEHKLRVLFGTDEDAGKVRISVDNVAGKFETKRDKKGNYAITLNAATVDGLFSLNFQPFTVDRCEALRPTNGQPPHFVFQATADMLAVEE